MRRYGLQPSVLFSVVPSFLRIWKRAGSGSPLSTCILLPPTVQTVLFFLLFGAFLSSFDVRPIPFVISFPDTFSFLTEPGRWRPESGGWSTSTGFPPTSARDLQTAITQGIMLLASELAWRRWWTKTMGGDFQLAIARVGGLPRVPSGHGGEKTRPCKAVAGLLAG